MIYSVEFSEKSTEAVNVWEQYHSMDSFFFLNIHNLPNGTKHLIAQYLFNMSMLHFPPFLLYWDMSFSQLL